ncbi:polyphosphate kinase 2 family protein [Taklimakanibacter lacteus]|uniref:polyphosphate kinase 2 family protein n=1 Tax=Taklimakanibacter lacteus TaxID=2268456 RepID=UPI000E662453
MANPFAGKFRVEGRNFALAKVDPRDDSAFAGKEKAKAQIAEDAEAINQLQDRLYAEGDRSLLVVLQGIDCSGKDGTVRAVFNTCGPIGVEVTPFKVPSEEERDHDYLWRVHKACPRKGIIGIFNRSHYEDVLVVKVKKLARPEAIERRYEEINQFEKMLSDNGTRILKFMLHISKEEQAERLKERVTDPTKQWKFNPGDLADRKLWDDYMAAYETALKRCSTAHAPWHVIPADRNWTRNAAIARVVRETLEDMAPKYPPPDGWDPKTVVIE